MEFSDNKKTNENIKKVWDYITFYRMTTKPIPSLGMIKKKFKFKSRSQAAYYMSKIKEKGLI